MNVSKNKESEVADDAVLDDEIEPQAEDTVTENPDGAAEQEALLDEDRPEEPADEIEVEEPSEDEIEPELIGLATAGGDMTEAEARARGRIGLLAYLDARARLKSDEKKKPEEDPFVLNLDPEIAADLPPALVQEMKRLAKASRDGIKAARDEIEPLKAEVETFRKMAQAEVEQRNFNALQDWCDQQKDDDLGDSRSKDLTEKQKKIRWKMWKEVLGVRSNLRADAHIAVSDVCEIALNKVFKGKRKQQARRKVAKAATRQSESAVGRASTVKPQPGKNNTRRTSEESVGALLRGRGTP